MAGTTWDKRQREKAKREKKQARALRREMKREQVDEPEEGPNEEVLMKRFAQLNQARAAGRIDEDTFLAQRDEIWEAMGLPPRPAIDPMAS